MTPDRGDKWKLKPNGPSFRFDRLETCYGKRYEDYPKCKECPHLEHCSFETLAKDLHKQGFKVTSSCFGDLIYVDKEG